MKRLVAFGCSNTYGVGLRDCWKATGAPFARAGDLPSQYAWPKILADLLGRMCCNNGISSASNLEILQTILSYKFVSDDIIVVLWTFSDRDMVFVPGESLIRLHAYSDTPLLKPWTEVHSTYDLKMRTWLQIHHAYHYIKNIGVKFYFLETKSPPDSFTPPNWLRDIEFLDIDIQKIQNIYPLAQDNLHPGEECHKEYARLIWNQIGK
jgi:hypothetical protein